MPVGNEQEHSHRVRPLSRLDIAGGGQVTIQNGYAFVGHMEPPAGTTIVDVRDPRNPVIVAEIKLPDDRTHTHKVRVAGDLMIVNSEQHRRHFLRRAAEIPEVEKRLSSKAGKTPTDSEIAAELDVTRDQLDELRFALANPYDEGGFRLYDISTIDNPREIAFVKTGGVGVHRFDCDNDYAYISTEMDGYLGNILVIYDIRDPRNVREVSRWWMPGQHVAGGEKPTWRGRTHRLHHALRHGSTLWAACWHGGAYAIDITDISRPRTIGHYNYHPPFPEPTHTFFRVPHRLANRDIAVVVDEEHAHVPGQPHGFMWLFDVSDPANLQPLSTFHVSECDSPWSRSGGRFGAHQCAETIGPDNLVYLAWFAGGLRIVDISDPFWPREVGSYLPPPTEYRPYPQSNDVAVDDRGVAYLIDRVNGLDIVSFDPT